MSSATLAERLNDNRVRTVQMEERAGGLEEQLEAARDDLGRAMAMDDAQPKIDALRQTIREATDELDGCDRGLKHLAAQSEELQTKLRAAQRAEAIEQRDAAVEEAVEAIDALAGSLDAALSGGLRDQVETALQQFEHAWEIERKAANLTHEVIHRSRVLDLGWYGHPALLDMAKLLRRYAVDPNGLAAGIEEDRRSVEGARRRYTEEERALA